MIRRSLILLFLVISQILAGCTGAPPEATPTALPTRSTPTLSPTAAPSLTASANTQPASLTPAPRTPTTTQPAAQMPIPSATQPAPSATLTPTNLPTLTTLDDAGPWLFFSAPDAQYLANADGSGLSGVETVPMPQPGWMWNWQAAPAGPHLLLHADDQGTPLLEAAPGEWDYQMWVMRLPGLSLMREIPLLTHIGRGRIRAELAANADRLPTPLAVARDLPALWSPDGRYVAFSAALHRVNVDIYLYDTEIDLLQRITTSSHDALLRAWSPDGRWIIYEQVSGSCDVDGVSATCAPEGVAAVSLFGTQISLYQQTAPEAILAWQSQHSFLVHHIAANGPPSNLRLVDLYDQEERPLYLGAFGSAALDPFSGVVMLNLSTGPYWRFEGGPVGIYRLGPQSSSPEQVLAGDYQFVTWAAAPGLFLAEDFNGPPYEAILFDSSGAVQLRLEDVNVWSKSQSSPDGRWMLVRHSDGYSLHTAEGNMLLSLGAGRVTWMPDASAFYFLSCQESMTLYRYEFAQTWRGTLLAEGLPACLDMTVVTP